MQLGMSSTKMKSLLKGLRYISQVFAIEGEKEEEMQIGNPTDVKHVAHIGWDGPSDNATAPSWMNDFKSSPVMESIQGLGEDDSSVKCQSEFGGRTRDLPKLPKSTRKSSSEKGSPTKERSDKTKRRTSNKGTSSSRRTKDEDSTSSSRRTTKDEDSSLSQHSAGLPEVPKKSKRKKSKEAGNGGSSRSSRISEADYMSDTGSARSMPQFEDDRNGF
ncbi:CRIB domain-containing protein RIC7 [Arabidopsis thaliana]|uniref:RIC7 n=5 Tax=Arabidopsis TaxID=3701 RepID=A0A178UU24_ARATH|nr:CRIB domain [Arabidopsis thaliana x Arabidopsis arenosa]KAG7622141.1 CRIB domain [Arabidopsis suecica]OAO97113.1 RIC7 [Arabidopsis thaliana]